jgi:hypothetical protein
MPLVEQFLIELAGIEDTLGTVSIGGLPSVSVADQASYRKQNHLTKVGILPRH